MKTTPFNDHYSAGGSYVRRAHVAAEVLFQGKWQIQVLCAMRHGPVRIGQLGRLIPGASTKMLVQVLRKLEADGIVVRQDLSELILHVEYDLHDEVRESVFSLLDHLSAWGATFLSSGSDRAPSPRK